MLCWGLELSMNPGEVLVHLKGNLIHVLSKREFSWSGADGWGKSHEIGLNASKAIKLIHLRPVFWFSIAVYQTIPKSSGLKLPLHCRS